MPFNRPDLLDLIERSQAEMDSRLGGSPWLRRRLLSVLARMDAGLAHGLYGYLDWLALQIMPDTAEREHLDRWASIWLERGRKPATKAQSYATYPGVDGTVLPSGTEMQRPDGVRYVALADAVARDDRVRVAVEAVEAGLTGNAAAGTPLQLIEPILGLEAQGAADGEITGGAEEESDTSLRTRLLDRIRNQPSGGAARDYVTWALSVPGVTRAWCYPGEMGRGSVTVRFVMDNTYADGIPHADDVARVKAFVDSVRPVTADVYVVAPVPHPIDLDLRISPDTPRVRVAVEEAAWAQLRREAEPGGLVVVSRLNEAISLADGEEDHTLLSPAANIQLPVGEMAVPGVISWGDDV
ncbi:baseplate J/gp47 family protein [uncultured Desulfovibrio sp.]|uniref:baseplate J/gp47 family protein n=1 Tax=uncultured Desulfovibrio sp. TaxID=167968 RepID=UPI002588B6A0|nr:baseplate J/gp47 family protein [uncultured Desulfovibrio sp.]